MKAPPGHPENFPPFTLEWRAGHYQRRWDVAGMGPMSSRAIMTMQFGAAQRQRQITGSYRGVRPYHAAALAAAKAWRKVAGNLLP